MSTSRGPRGRAAGLSRSAPGSWMASELGSGPAAGPASGLASGPATGPTADTSRRVPPDSSDNSPPLVPTQVPTPPSGILLVLARLRPRSADPGAEGEMAGREVLDIVRA